MLNIPNKQAIFVQAIKQAVYFMNKELILNSVRKLISEEITNDENVTFALVVLLDEGEKIRLLYGANIDAKELIYTLSFAVCGGEPKTL